MRRRLLRTLRREDGFTLTELLAATSILGVLFAMFAVIVGSTVTHSSEISDETVLQAEVRGAIDRLAQDLRQAYSGDDTVPPIEIMTGTSIQFLSPDRTTPFHLRRIAYQVSGNVLQRRTALSTDTDGVPWDIPPLGGWAPAAKLVTNTTVFAYKDAAGNTTTDPASVRTVYVTMIVSPVGSRDKRFTYTTSITVRKTKLEL